MIMQSNGIGVIIDNTGNVIYGIQKLSQKVDHLVTQTKTVI